MRTLANLMMCAVFGIAISCSIYGVISGIQSDKENDIEKHQEHVFKTISKIDEMESLKARVRKLEIQLIKIQTVLVVKDLMPIELTKDEDEK